ncbi:MAG: class I SAM-dependent methyltransferase [Alphaproteobacteria bacterium]|nr:class I SAM-dependent methyltransferase [Alphaproteobacteria bacterium]
MALTRAIVGLLVQMRRAGLFDLGTARMIELGEQNLYGNISARDVVKVAQLLKLDERRIAGIEAEIRALIDAPTPLFAFDLAKLLYRIVFDCATYRAIDLNGTEAAWRHDLNRPLPIAETFDVVTNFGTSEHVFDQAQLFRSIHGLTRPGGLMLHAVPHQGGPDHGFYNYHPTFFHDLAAANAYRLVMLVLMSGKEDRDQLDAIRERDSYASLLAKGPIAGDSGLFVAMMRPFDDRPFELPMQGYYTGELSDAARTAWEDRR